MRIAFQIMLTLYIFIVVFTIWTKREIFSSGTYIAVGVCIPLVMYLQKWSEWITKEPSWEFYLIFISLFLLSGFSMLMQRKPLEMSGYIRLRKPAHWVLWLNIAWLCAVLLENYIGSGMFFPALRGVDVHLRQVPLLMYITRANYVIVAVNVICYFTEHRRRYLLWGLLHILLPVVSASSRMMATVCMLQAASLFVFLWKNGYSGRSVVKRRRRLGGKQIAMICVLALAGGFFLIRVGMNRMNHYGKYAVLYSQGIRYTGPLGEIGAWLYGYFALSFDNLNMSIIAKCENPNYVGLFSFQSFYFGLLQFDNLIGVPSDLAQKACEYAVRAAIVPTGFWSFYYDYGILCFIPIIAAFVQEYFLRRWAEMSVNRIVWAALYFYFIPQWFFMNFTNTVFDVTALTTAIIGYIVLGRLFCSSRIVAIRRVIITEE